MGTKKSTIDASDLNEVLMHGCTTPLNLGQVVFSVLTIPDS